MTPEDSIKLTQASKEALDVISSRISIALAKHDKIVKSWITLSSRPKDNEKTQEELEAEDAALFRKTPQYLGVGAPIPSHFLVSDAERNNKSLRAKFFPAKGLKGGKPRDREEKAASAKRSKVEESSDEEAGRSALGKAKKLKRTTDRPSKATEVEEKSYVKGGNDPTTLSKRNSNIKIEKTLSKEVKDSQGLNNQDQAPTILENQSPKSAEELRREKKRQRKLSKKKQKKKNKNKGAKEAV